MTKTRNPWPIGIVVTFVVFISGTAGLIVMACLQKEELVSSDYYEQEIRFQHQLDRVDRTRPWQTQVSVDYDAGQKCIRISLPAEHARHEAKGCIRLYRPSDTGLDQDSELALSSDGHQTIDAKSLRPGLWKVRVLWTVERQDYSIDEKVVVGPKTP